MIQEISFKNFRRFEEFQIKNLGSINIFVGRNNAGKSTVMKAIQLLKSNLRSLSYITTSNSIKPMFVFDVDKTSELHIDNFERALYKNAKRKEITLSTTLDGLTYTLVLDGQSIEQNNFHVAVPYNMIELKSENLHIKFNFQTRDMLLELKTSGDPRKSDDYKVLIVKKEDVLCKIADVEMSLSAIASQLQGKEGKTISNNEMIALVSKRQNLEQILKSSRKQLDTLNSEIKEIESANKGPLSVCVKNFPEFTDLTQKNVINLLFSSLVKYAQTPIAGDKRTSEYKEKSEVQKQIKTAIDILNKEAVGFVLTLYDLDDMEYIHAHAASQKVIYLKEDKADALSRALAEFRKAGVQPGQEAWRFVKTWMGKNNFGIGDDFSIDDIQSAGYTLKIIDDGEELNLADKGTGSIQLMTLLLSLAVILNKNERPEGYCPTLLIEEPEQNIHPMLQSLLADMLFDFQKKYWYNDNCQLIIETHSEYLIRRTQLLVAIQNYKNEEDLNENNPFRVFYFPSEKGKQPYDMEYQPNGLFAKKFDAGFFDEAGRMHMQILKNSKKG